MVISQADRKIHEKFSEKINKIPPDKKKKKKIYISITEEQDIKSNKYPNKLNIKGAIVGIIIIHFLIIYNSPSRFWRSGSRTENYQNR
jgi:hypothetical protein